MPNIQDTVGRVRLRLSGLPGLNNVSEYERQQFMLDNADALKKYRRADKREKAAEILYNNQQFIRKFGLDAFNSTGNSKEAYDARNALLREKAVNDAVEEYYKPTVTNGIVNKNTGAGEDWERISTLSTDAKEKLLRSDYVPQQDYAKAMDSYKDTGEWINPVFKGLSYIPVVGKVLQSFDPGNIGREIAANYVKDRNKKILDTVYNDDADAEGVNQGVKVYEAYRVPEIVGTSDEDTKRKFKEAITPSETNLGIPDYAAHWGDGTDTSEEMSGFSIDDMRKVLAKKFVYDRTMTPHKAMTALNNEAKRYLRDKQGTLKTLGLLGNDIFISALSYTADKLNGIYNVYLAGEDWLSAEKPKVWIDTESNEVVDPKNVRLENGEYVTRGKDGAIHPVRQREINRRTLHNMGKNEDGSDADEGIFSLNPVYWTRAEQFKTLDADEQKQYENIGASPYSVVYDPNSDSDLLYEAFKMTSFGLADTASTLIPFGIGAVGRGISGMAKAGSVVGKMGKGLDFLGKSLSFETRAGQAIQGAIGAGGIAYAYQRGAFQESLAENLANVEEANLNRSKKEFAEDYSSNSDFKKEVDSRVNLKASEIAQQYESQGIEISDDEKNKIISQARDIVTSEIVAEKARSNKGTQEYADLVQNAISSAGDAAWMSFWPEAAKYTLVNNFGHRRFLYTNPMGLKKKLSPGMKGLEEVTTEGGKKRLAVTKPKFENRLDRAKQLGKVALSQVWGGAWTNGTDDMMVDAAERINKDSFDKYLNAYENGEALADEYGFIDGMYSYWRGLVGSLGQSTTWNAAAVGGLGSVLSAAPNMVNMASLFSKSGRNAYRNRFQKEAVYETDKDGISKIKRDKDGNPIMKDVRWYDNPLDRFSFFFQNGVLNNYYGAKQGERELLNHAEYVNSILDDSDDFKAIKNLIASNIDTQNAETIGDEKTMRFLNAFESMRVLERLSKDKNDAVKMSSVVDDALALIEGASKLGTEESTLSEDQVNNLLSEYHANNPGKGITEESNNEALGVIAKNATKMQEAYKAFNEAVEHVSNYERDNKISIASPVRDRLVLTKALTGHWEDRINTMKKEIGDTSSSQSAPEGDTLIAVMGGKQKARQSIKDYDKQIEKGLKSVGEKVASVEKALSEYNEAQKALREADDPETTYNMALEVKRAKDKYENAVEERNFEEDILEAIKEKKQKLSEALEVVEKGQTRVLTAEEIMSLDPEHRAIMLSPANKVVYSKKQRAEIEKLEAELKMKDPSGDPIQKVQDIALLTRRVAQAKDAYNRMSRNPDAAALKFEMLEEQEAEKAHELINKRNAQILANAIEEVAYGLKSHRVKKSDISNVVYRMLRKHSPTLLDIIESDGQSLLPQYTEEVNKAKEWSKVVNDIKAVIDNSENSQEWKDNIYKNIENVIENSNSREEIISSLEKVIDDVGSKQASDDFNTILNGLEQLGYQRDATVLENREQRKKREAEQARQLEAKKKELEERAKAEEAKAKEAGKETNQKEELSETVEDTGQSSADAHYDGQVTSEVSEKNGVKITKFNLYRATKSGEVKRVSVGGLSIDPSTINEESLQEIGEYESIQLSELREGKDGKMNGTILIKSKDLPGLMKIDVAFTRNPVEGTQLGTQQNTETSVNTNMEDNLTVDNGETVGGRSETIEEQAAHGQTEGGKVFIIEENTDDIDTGNEIVEHVTENSETTLSGNALSEWVISSLKDEHRLVHKQGDAPNDSMNHFYAWMQSRGIKLQNIIDRELGNIIKLNPHAPVKFMSVRPEKGVLQDVNISNHLFLVLDYDDSINKHITKIHNEDNGGVIDVLGKKYLIIGVAGYRDINSKDSNTRKASEGKRNLYDVIYSRDRSKLGLLRKGSREYFEKNPTEEFRVLDGVNTEIVPWSLIPGYIVKQTEKDENNHTYRKISDLLNDPERNPLGVESLRELSWGIQEYTQLLVVGANRNDVMAPRNTIANSGRAFAFIPASNGKLVPIYFRPLMYNEMQEGALKETLDNLLRAVGRPKYEDRLKAIQELGKILYLSDTGDNILIGKDGTPREGQITLMHGKQEMAKFTAGNDFDVAAFLLAIGNLNPRINITRSVLQSPNLLEQYDEAGALMTDAASLVTAGASYSIYGIDAEGKMLTPENPLDNPAFNRDSSFTNDNERQVIYKSHYYSYDLQEGKYYLRGTLVQDESLIKQLDYNRRIIENSLSPVESKGVWDTYILGSKDHPEGIRVNRNTYEVEEIPEDKAVEILERIEKEESDKERDNVAAALIGAEPIEINIDEESSEESSEISEDAKISSFDELSPEQPEITVPQEDAEEIGKSNEVPNTPASSTATQNFDNLAKSRKWRSKVKDLYGKSIGNIIKEKWPDAPSNMKELASFLKSKNVEVDAISNTESGVKAWIETIINCR